MSYVELAVLAIGLAADAFAVSICTGLGLKKVGFKEFVIVGLWFGVFQAGMPAIGYLLGSNFADAIVSVDHWIAFVLLSIIGIKMIRESFSRDDDTEETVTLNVRRMLPLAVATSIDALAVGVTFAFLRVDILFSVSAIGIVTFILSAVGVKVGAVFGLKFKSTAERLGGAVLILMGIKILVEHLFF